MKGLPDNLKKTLLQKKKKKKKNPSPQKNPKSFLRLSNALIKINKSSIEDDARKKKVTSNINHIT